MADFGTFRGFEWYNCPGSHPFCVKKSLSESTWSETVKISPERSVDGAVSPDCAVRSERRLDSGYQSLMDALIDDNAGSRRKGDGENPEPKKVIIHKNVLCDCSSYFRALFNSNFREALTNKLTLEIDHTTLLAFTDWLYKRDERYEALMVKPVCLLLSLWVFGDEKGIPLLQSHITHVLVDRATLNRERSQFPFPPRQFVRIFNLDDIDYVYENTAPGAKLRKLLVDYFTRDQAAFIEQRENNKEHEPPTEFLEDCLLVVQAQARGFHLGDIAACALNRADYYEQEAASTEALVLADDREQVTLQSIPALAKYRPWSFEELRMADYKRGRRRLTEGDN